MAEAGAALCGERDDNTVVLRGRVSSAPAVRELPSGAVITTFRVSVPRARTLMTAGSRQSVDWVDCTAWGARVRRAVAGWEVGDRVEVQATVFRDGHEILGAQVLYRGPGEKAYRSAPLELLWNDLFVGSFEVDRPGRWEFLVEAWGDRAATWRDEEAEEQPE